MSRSELYTFIPVLLPKSTAYKNLCESAKAGNVELQISFIKNEAEYECSICLSGVCFGTGTSSSKHRAKKTAADDAMRKLMLQYPTIRVNNLWSNTYFRERMLDEDFTNYVDRSKWLFMNDPTIDMMLLRVTNDEERKSLQELCFHMGYQSSYGDGLVSVTRKKDYLAIYFYLKTHENHPKYEIYFDI
jgi:hypothetical protein